MHEIAEPLNFDFFVLVIRELHLHLSFEDNVEFITMVPKFEHSITGIETLISHFFAQVVDIL
jgi:hypothetical protein